MSQHHARLDARRWAKVRRAVFERDGWRCRRCGKAGRLEADHVVPLDKDRKQDPYAVEGCQTLCRTCHIAKTADENTDPMRRPWRDWVREIAKS